MSTTLGLCALVATSALAGSDGKAHVPAIPLHSGEVETPYWEDVDGDGLLDLVAVGRDGRLQILSNNGDGHFDDVTEALGLSTLQAAHLLLWADYDGDGRVDLFVGAREGASCLLHNETGSFTDMTAGSGLVISGTVQSAHWLDHDGDGYLDLHVITAQNNDLFRGLEGGFFDRIELPPLAAPAMQTIGTSSPTLADVDSRSATTTSTSDRRPSASGGGSLTIDNSAPNAGRPGIGPTPTVTSALPLLPGGGGCANSIRDQANLATCLQATSVPTAGMLFPGPHLGGVNNVQSGTNSFVGGGKDNTAGPGNTGNGHTTIGGGEGNYALGNFSTVAGGQGNTANGQYASIGGGFNNLAANGNGNGSSTVGGGGSNNASGSYSTVGGGHFNEATDTFATIGGGDNNSAHALATVGGGDGNDATGVRATVGGGTENTAVGYASTVGGGGTNFAVGRYSTVAGGKGNFANFPGTSGNTHGAVGGGRDNNASGSYATVAGGGGYFLGNQASGLASTVPGGRLNVAAGDFSFAAGRRAKANHAGSFVWGDGQDLDKTSSSNDEFSVYASGGARIFSNSSATTGVLLAPGGGSWSSVSDRDAKENFERVDPRLVLEQVCELPISTWNYKAQDDAIRHMGAMAQDFRAAFGLGVSDTMIDTIDPDGVALAAIQGLNELLAERLSEKDAELTELRERVARLEELVSGLQSSAPPLVK